MRLELALIFLQLAQAAALADPKAMLFVGDRQGQALENDHVFQQGVRADHHPDAAVGQPR